MAVPLLARETIDDLCGSRRWRELMCAGLPFATVDAALAAAQSTFDTLGREDWLEAFSTHSTIGVVQPGDWTGAREQSGLSAEDGELRTALAAANVEYCSRFGFVFLIRARGRSGREILDALHERLDNTPAEEFATACAQQREITALRLGALNDAQAA